MRVSTLDGVPALAAKLIDAGLIGGGAFSFGGPDLVIFNSGGPITHLAQHSILCGPSNKRIIVKQPENKKAVSSNKPMNGEIEIIYDKTPFIAEVEEWRHGCWYHLDIISATSITELLEKLNQLTPNEMFNDGSKKHIPTGPFWAGALSYDMIQWTQPISLQSIPKSGKIITILWLIEDFIIYSKNDDDYTVFGSTKEWKKRVEMILSRGNISCELSPIKINNSKEISDISDLDHIKKINEIKSSITDGIFYQVNFGRFWTGELVEEPFTIFQRLTLENPAPFSLFLEAPDLGLAIASCSPETLLRCNQGKLYTAPIKGTVNRGKNKSEDLAMIASMIADIKERSEHRMLVDLMRNDLSAVCKVGSVNISRFDVESYANVHHLVSHIEGELIDGKSSYDALNSIFPGGSITGCPRTMVCGVIDEIENKNRSFWTGSAGWFQPSSGDCSWNILIRTLEATRVGKIWHGSVGAGGGITIRSEPGNEVKETIWKSQAIRKACAWLPQDFDNSNSGNLEKTSLEIENRFLYQNPNSINIITSIDDLTPQLSNQVLLIDNLDSFTLNIAHAVAGLGFKVNVINGRDNQANKLAESDELVDLLQKLAPSHIILGPGPGRPNDSKITMKIANLALHGLIKIPILGVCLGHQALGLNSGYNLIKDPFGAVHGTPVMCQNDGSGLFKISNKSNSYVRYNSLLITGDIKEEMVPNIFDENGAIMGLRHKSLPIHSVQFHPESIGSSNGIKIFMAFLQLQSDA